MEDTWGPGYRSKITKVIVTYQIELEVDGVRKARARIDNR